MDLRTASVKMKQFIKTASLMFMNHQVLNYKLLDAKAAFHGVTTARVQYFVHLFFFRINDLLILVIRSKHAGIDCNCHPIYISIIGDVCLYAINHCSLYLLEIGRGYLVVLTICLSIFNFKFNNCVHELSPLKSLYFPDLFLD